MWGAVCGNGLVSESGGDRLWRRMGQWGAVLWRDQSVHLLETKWKHVCVGSKYDSFTQLFGFSFFRLLIEHCFLVSLYTHWPDLWALQKWILLLRGSENRAAARFYSDNPCSFSKLIWFQFLCNSEPRQPPSDKHPAICVVMEGMLFDVRNSIAFL